MIIGKAALLVIDVQHDFIDDDAPVHCEGGNEKLPKIKQLIEACRRADIPVIYTQEVHRSSHVDMGRDLGGNEPDHCILGTKGVGIMEEISPKTTDIIATKPRYNAFLGTVFLGINYLQK